MSRFLYSIKAQKYDKSITTLSELNKWVSTAPASILMENIDLTIDWETVETTINRIWAPLAESEYILNAV